jgi:hypothetical protein
MRRILLAMAVAALMAVMAASAAAAHPLRILRRRWPRRLADVPPENGEARS